MRLDVGGVDGRAVKDAAAPGQGLEHLEPKALPAPAVEAVVDRRVRPKLRRAVAPARSALEHVDDAGDHPTIVYTVRALAPARQQRLDPRSLFIGKPLNLLGHLFKAPVQKP